jgi:transposase-like protein
LYVWVGGIRVNVRLGDQDRLCLLVMLGARPDGKKELIAGRPRDLEDAAGVVGRKMGPGVRDDPG